MYMCICSAIAQEAVLPAVLGVISISQQSLAPGLAHLFPQKYHGFFVPVKQQRFWQAAGH